jgi:hypothetical protein
VRGGLVRQMYIHGCEDNGVGVVKIVLGPQLPRPSQHLRVQRDDIGHGRGTQQNVVETLLLLMATLIENGCHSGRLTESIHVPGRSQEQTDLLPG